MKKAATIPHASQAHLTMAMCSTLRVRQMADLVRGKSIEWANQQLTLSPKKPAKIMLKLLRSAMANAAQKGTADLDRLYVSELQVNEGPRIKRFMPRAQGRADGRWTRTSHITMKLAEKAAPAKKPAKKKAKGE